MLYHNNVHLKGWISYDDKTGWEFQIRRRNGEVRFKTPLPHLLTQHTTMIDKKHLLPGWSNSTRQLIATAHHVSAKKLKVAIAPKTLRRALLQDAEDRLIWLAAYLEEIQGLLQMNTFRVITESEYQCLLKKHGIHAIPTMAVLTVKFDGHGDPVRAKARIVVLDNLDKTEYTKGDCYAPVASHYAVRLITALAIIHNRLLQRGDCKNAFVQSKLTDLVIVHPPPDCPYSHPNTYWLLEKSLYGHKKAPRYWYDRINNFLSDLNLKASPNEPCFFSGHPLSDKAPLFLVIYVDDFIYFSPDDEVERHFEKLMADKVVVDFMGSVDFFLGIRFDWNLGDKSNFRVKLVQEAYSETIVHKMGLRDANKDAKMTPYRSGLPIDSLPTVTDQSTEKQKSITALYRNFVGMLTWLASSTRPDISTVVSFLSSYQSCPSEGHIDAAKWVGRYLNSTLEKGLNFDHKEANRLLEGYTQYPVEDGLLPTAYADSNWGPQDASHPTEKNNRKVSLLETRSTCGFLVFMGGAPVMWKVFKEARSSRSSCEAEIKASDECTKGIQFFRDVLTDIGLGINGPTNVYNDNRGAIDWAHTLSNKRMRHFNIRENCVREAVLYKEILFNHIPGKLNPGDLMTKEHKSDEIFLDIRDLCVW